MSKKRFFLLASLGILFAVLTTRSARAATANVIVLDETRILAENLEASTPAEALALANTSLAPADIVLVNGERFPPDAPFLCTVCIVQIRRATSFSLVTTEGNQTLSSAAFTLGNALWNLGIRPYAADEIYPSLFTSPHLIETVEYHPSRTLTLITKDTTTSFRSSAETIGEALAEAGIPLEGLDYTLPSASEAPPKDGQIRLVQVREVIQLTLTPLPYESELQPAPDVEIDQRVVLQPGSYGLRASKTRVRYEDGVETLRTQEITFTLREPKNEIIGYGTKIVIRTMQTPYGVIEYWRAVPVYATSYSPCNSDADRCYYKTASGKPVQQGVVGVVRSWYMAMQGQPVYIPTYGLATIEDLGAGIPGRYLVDLGYTDEDYVPHHEWTTLYFLTPVPDNILWILP